MKVRQKRREGTLKTADVQFNWLDPADVDEAIAYARARSILSLEDLLSKASKLGNAAVSLRGSIRARLGKQLRANVVTAQQAMAVDPNRREWIELGTRIGLTYANLRAEIRDDERPDPRRRITRASYFAAKRRHKTQEAIAEHLGVSVEALRKWRRANIE